MYKCLIVEDDKNIAECIKALAKRWNIECEIAEDFRNVLSEFAALQPHIVLIDIGLPVYSGYYWCGEIRKVSKVPVIFVSSASDNMNIVMAVNMGADDYIVKPFDGEVLMAKMQALLRRTYDFGGQANILEHKGALLNTEDGTLLYQGKNIPLTKNEHRILLCLMENKGKIVSRDRLMLKLWKTHRFVDDNTLTVNVGRLRKKLESFGLVGFITTKPGDGYIVE